MESAIPNNLRCPRTTRRRISEDYMPPYPAWVSRMNPKVAKVVMAYLGVQYRGDVGRAKALRYIEMLALQFGRDDGPQHHDLTHYVDESGYENLITIAYWDEALTYQRWLAASTPIHWWRDPDSADPDVGYFREIISPSAERLETLFSTRDRFEGVSCLSQSVSNEIQEHGYWGSARERLPIAQTDMLEASGERRRQIMSTSANLVRVLPHDQLTLIRSGQDWSDTAGQERDIYVKEVAPTLRLGMNYLTESGLEIGCYSNRYMRHVNSYLEPNEKSFGVSFWRSLDALERWSESHPTHVAIFGSFMKMVQAMNFDLKLRLYHEVTVARADEQFYEYLNCHPKTGVLHGT